jgi:regulatory protein
MNSEALEKLKHYCAYQERSHQDVRTKLLELKIYGNDLENVMTALIEENYLNEERFACALARGKFYYKNWGRNKILQSLRQHQVSDYCIKKAIKEIDEQDYQNTISKLAEKKLETLKTERNKFTKMTKLRNYLLQKGYEYENINLIIKSYL